MTLKDSELGKYQHFKNRKFYKVIGTAWHSETLEEMVIYQALYDSEKFGNQQIWVRPRKMFFEHLEHDGKRVPRFAKVKE